MKRLRRIGAWWLSRPQGYPIQDGWYRGSKIDGLVRLLFLLFMLTAGLPITAVHWVLYVRRLKRNQREGRPLDK